MRGLSVAGLLPGTWNPTFGWRLPGVFLSMRRRTLELPRVLNWSLSWSLSRSLRASHLSRSDAAYVPRRHIRVHWSGQQSAAVGPRHVNEEPVVVMGLLVEHTNGLLFARTSDTEYRSPAKHWPVEARAGTRT